MKKTHIFINCLLMSSLLIVSNVYANDPVLRFSDLISGPGTGLEDGVGSGIIVTVWGQHLGSSQDSSSISFIDSLGVSRKAEHVYYWKNADGELPSGPSNLYESHRMQEIAFSIPDSAPGLGQIAVTVGGGSTTLPFTVRDGLIFHVMSTGSDATGNGSFDTPWQTVDKAIDSIAQPGSTIYIHDVQSGEGGPGFAILWDKASASSSKEAQFGFVAYPGSRPFLMGARGISNYNVDGLVVSKLDIYASNYTAVDANGQIDEADKIDNVSFCLFGDKYGRAVGNRCTDLPGGCASGFQGAFTANALNADQVSGFQMLGNEIYEYGCQGGRKFQHTTYMSVRDVNDNNYLNVEAWRVGWNYLHDNHTKNGLHAYDESQTGDFCGSPVGTVIYNDNVVVNQPGAGFNVSSSCPWTADFEVYNNVFINVGLVQAWDGIDTNTTDGPVTSAITIGAGSPGLGLEGTVRVYNNTIHTWNDDDVFRNSRACLGTEGSGDAVTITWENNVCVTLKDKPFLNKGVSGDQLYDNISGTNNVWYYGGSGTPASATPPAFDATPITADPLINISGPSVSLGLGSSLIGQSSFKPNVTHDIYGFPRTGGTEIGAIEYLLLPEPPTNLSIQ
jgi:hypothetical protein